MVTILSFNVNSKFLAFQLLKGNVVLIEPGMKLSEVLRNNQVYNKVLFQVNLSQYNHFFSDTDDPHYELKSKGYDVINEGLYDISKKKLYELLEMANLESLKCNYHPSSNELVIIKSNLNYGAKWEKKLKRKFRKQLKIAKIKNVPNFDEYSVVRYSEISKKVLNNDQIVIEKFISNDQGKYLRIHKLFEKIIISEIYRPGENVKKMNWGSKWNDYTLDLNNLKHPYFEHAHINSYAQTVLAFLNSSNIDFCTFDLVVDNDENCYIIDLNDTPAWGNPQNQGDLIIKHLLSSKEITG